ncbi:unnamed protein product [Cercospora beticola]|nr:unnamed protein product [Cercospora beticola]
MACSAFFIARYTIRSAATPISWNYDSITILPSIIRDLLQTTDASKSFSHFTETPQVREADPHLQEHPWRLALGLEREAFYHQYFGHNKIFLLSAEDMKRIGKDPTKYAHIGEDWGYGDKIYPARLDFTHQMHCIHVLHTMLNPIDYKINATEQGGVTPLVNGHGEHCLWALYDYISCHVSWDVYSYKWLDGFPRPYPDHASQRQCRSWKPLHDFYLENDVSTDARILYMVPQPGDHMHPMTDEQRARDAAIRDAAGGSLLQPDEWLVERRKMFNEAMQHWRDTGEIPRVAPLTPEEVNTAI